MEDNPMREEETNEIYSKMAIEIMEQMKKGKDTTSLVNKDNILSLLEKIKENDSNYYYCHTDLKKGNDIGIANFTKHEKIIYEAIKKKIEEKCNFDVIFYKIGEKCNGWKKRFAIIVRGGLYSSTKPLKFYVNFKGNLKDVAKEKTRYLDKSIISLEQYKFDQKNLPEWQEPNLKFRMKIEYDPNRALATEKKNNGKKKRKWFVFYFETAEKMEFVRELLFGMDDNDEIVIRNLSLMQKSIEGSFNFYGILKMLAVKNKIKKRKALLNQLKGKSNQSVTGLINFGKRLIKKNFVEKHNNSKINKLKAAPAPKRKKKFEYVPSDFQPIITSLPKNYPDDNKDIYFSLGESSINNIYDDDTLFKTQNEMDNKINKLKNCFPNILNDNGNPENNIEFIINNGVYVDNKNAVDPNKMIKANLISINKNKPEIIFIDENNENNNEIIDTNKIYNISNVILNSNKDINGKEENNLVILGPKMDLKKGIEYSYENQPTMEYIDPELVGIKYNNGDLFKNKRNLICLQIFQLIYEMPQNQLNQIANIARKQNINIDVNNPENDFYFYHTVNIGNNLKKKSNLVKAKKYKNDHFIVEFNKQYYFREEDIKDKMIIVDCHCIPCNCFNDNLTEEQKNFLVDYMKPYHLGKSDISLKSIESNQNEYPLEKDGKMLPESTKILVFGFNDFSNEKPTIGLKGKDYSIGDNMYIVKSIDKNYIESSKEKSDLPYELLEKYYDIKFDKYDNILFRPCLSLSKEDFKNDISQQVSNDELNKIFENEKFNFLPECEKVVDDDTIFKSKNLSCLTKEQKKQLKQEKSIGDWIYKFPKINVRTLSKNLGVDRENNINQENYFSNENEQLNIKDLQNREKTYPISENNFNIFDMNKLYNDNLNNFDNYQWKISTQFNNEDQMKTFLKVLENTKQLANLKKEKESIPDDIDYHKTLEHLKQKNSSQEKVNIGIRNIFFREDYNLPFDSLLKFSFEKGKLKKTGGKSLLEKLQVEEYNFENSILLNKEVRDALEEIKKLKGSFIPIKGEKKILKNEFNEGNKGFSFKKKLYQNIPIIKGIDQSIDFNIKFENINNPNQYEDFFSTIDLNETFQKNAAIGQWPIYKRVKNDNDNDNESKGFYYEDKIYGGIQNDCWLNINNKGFNQLFFEANINYITNCEFLDMYKLGKYEPNVFRRKILKRIYDVDKFNCSPYEVIKKIRTQDNDDNIKKEFYNYLDKKCVIHPSFENIDDIDLKDIKLNNSKNDFNSNTFIKRFGIKTLHYQKADEFYDKYSVSEWRRFLYQLTKKKIPENFENIDLPELLGENRNEIFKNTNFAEKMRSVIYLGIPTVKGRYDVWEFLLDIKTLFEETKKKNNFDNFSREQIYDEYKKRNNEINIIYSLIDTDINYINNKNQLQDIDKIKNITKAFFRWTEDEIKLNDSKKNTKYVYFIGILSIVQTIFDYFKSESKTFWFLIGLSQCIDLFQQENPFYSENMSYINIYHLVIKLIIENNYNDIYKKFLELNFPIELLMGYNISSLFCDYFNGPIQMRILDILIFEATYKGYYGDHLQYLRILCTIPITLMHYKRNNILNCQSVSEMKTIFEDMIIGSYDINRFINKLYSNVKQFFTYNNIFEKWFNLNKDIIWDNKRDKIEKSIYFFFNPIRKENKEFLKPFEDNLNQKIIPIAPNQFIQSFKDEIQGKFENIRKLYGYGTPSYGDSNNNGLSFRINKFKPLFAINKEIKKELKVHITFSDFQKININRIDYWKETELLMNLDDLTIINQNDLFFNINFPNDKFNKMFYKYLHIKITETNDDLLCYFSFNISSFKLMRIEKIVLESFNDLNKKFLIEITLFKYSNIQISSDDIYLFKALFSSPEYNHNIYIENELNGYYINNKNDFNNSVKNYINEENNLKERLVDSLPFKDISALKDTFFNENKIYNNPDEYNILNEKYIKIDSKDGFKKNITSIVENKLLKIFEEENENIQNNNGNLLVVPKILEWLNKTNNSLEEILYCYTLIDKSSFTISEKLYLLFSIGQMRDWVIFNNEKISIDKVKEMIYSLYKRYLIYFTKNDVERMIDFLLKDERLFNLKYVLVYDSNNENQIKDLIFDINRFDPLQNQNIYYDNLSSKFNAYVNYFVNHYNLKSIPQSIVKLILKTIIEDDGNKNNYKQRNLDTIALVISRDNLQYIHLYKMNFDNFKIEEGYSYILNLNDKNNIEDIVLSNENNNLEINNSFAEKYEIPFEDFRNLFFQLPFLSELLRVSCSHMHQINGIEEESFEELTIAIITNDDRNSINNVFHPKKSNSIKDLIFDIIKNNNLDFLRDPSLFICEVVNTDTNINEEILYLDSFYSNLFLKNNKKATIKIIYNKQIISILNNNIIEKKDGYCKKFIDNENNYEWRKAKINEKNYVPTVISVDYTSKLILGQNDIVLDFDNDNN